MDLAGFLAQHTVTAAPSNTKTRTRFSWRHFGHRPSIKSMSSRSSDAESVSLHDHDASSSNQSEYEGKVKAHQSKGESSKPLSESEQQIGDDVTGLEVGASSPVTSSKSEIDLKNSFRLSRKRKTMKVLTCLANAYEHSPEAYENNSVVMAVIDGTLQNMPRAPDLFTRTRSSYPNGLWIQV